MNDVKVTSEQIVRAANAVGNATNRLGSVVAEALRGGVEGKRVILAAADTLYRQEGSQGKGYKALRTMLLNQQEALNVPDESQVTFSSPTKADKAAGVGVKFKPKGKSRGGNAKVAADKVEGEQAKGESLQAELAALVEKYTLDAVLDVLANMGEQEIKKAA